MIITYNSINKQNKFNDNEEFSKFLSRSDYNKLDIENVHVLNNYLNPYQFDFSNLYKCINLKKLQIIDHNISFIPKELFQLKNLESLKIQRNNLTNIPNEIGNLINLKEFVCCQNKIEELPETICNMV
jgi:Leucine-rich repeat (LRR) protein